MSLVLINGGFEADWGDERSNKCLIVHADGTITEEERSNIFTPPGWLTWFRHDPGTWDQPEVRDAWKANDPRRVHSGEKGMLLFTFSRKHDAGFLQQAAVEPGTKLRLTAWAHAWSNHKDKALPDKFPHPDDGEWSEGPGYDAGFCLEGEAPDDNWRNFTFWVGIDPTGGANPLADTVVWGRGAHIYNEYAEVPAVETVAKADRITVFLRSKTLWPFKHNDAYWDDVSLIAVDEPPSEPQRGTPRIQYTRTYVLLPQDADEAWATSAIDATWDQFRYTLGGSADDAGIGDLDVRRVVAINPDQWPSDLYQFYQQYYPSIAYDRVDAATPYELAVKLRPMLVGPINLSQRNAQWRNVDLGETAGGETIGEQGCLLTCLTMMLRQAYQRDATPPLINRLLARAKEPFTLDDHLTNWPAAIEMFPAFSNSIKRNYDYSVPVLKTLLAGGWLLALRLDGGAHFVYLLNADRDPLRCIDPWDGTEKDIVWSRVCGIRGALPTSNLPEPPDPTTPILVGLHDEVGGEWMAANSVKGCCLVHEQIQLAPRALDYARFEQAGIRVLCRLNWGYADGTGTFPSWQHRDGHIGALVNTILAARGVYAFHIGNEPNNAGEWPAGYVLTPSYVIGIYNEVYRSVAGRAKIGLTPLDPFYGPGSDNGEWWRLLLAGVMGAEALFLHTAKTQTNNVAEIESYEKFSDAPLQWQYLNCRSMETYLEMVPERFRSLPIYLSEANPQRRTATELGWLPDNAAWINTLMDYVRGWNRDNEQQVAGVVFYRYQRAGDQAPFGLEDKPLLLRTIKEQTTR